MSDGLTVYCFHASWCHSCPQVWKAFKEIANEMQDKNYQFVDLDVEEDLGVELSAKYQVRNVPTILVVKADRVVERIVGTRSKEELKQTLEKWK